MSLQGQINDKTVHWNKGGKGERMTRVSISEVHQARHDSVTTSDGGFGSRKEVWRARRTPPDATRLVSHAESVEGRRVRACVRAMERGYRVGGQFSDA